MSTISDLKRNAISELAQQVYDAYLSGTADIELPQISRWSGVPVETLADMGKSLVQSKLNHDIEADEYSGMIDRYRKVDQIEDPGLRVWKLQALARKYKRPLAYLQDAYNKALINQVAVEPMTVAQFKALHDQEVDWLIPGWIPTATTLLLHADGGTGKTLFAYQMMECVLYGRRWNGYPVKQGKVLLVQTDEPTIVTNERIDIRGIQDDAPLVILSDWQVEGLVRLEKYIEQEKPSLVIVDSLTSVNRGSIFSENDTEYARPVLELAAIANKHQCVVILIHHSNSDGNSRGTKAIYNSVSEVWGLSVSSESQQERLLRVQKTRLGRPPGRYKFQFDEDDFSFYYLGEDMGDVENAEQAATHEDKIRLWLFEEDQRGKRFTTLEIAEYLGVTKHCARRACYELWAKGFIRRVRPRGEKTWLYFAGENCSDPLQSNISTCDHAITCDHEGAITINAMPGEGLDAMRSRDHQNSGNFTIANSENERSRDRMTLNAIQGMAESVIAQNDRMSDRDRIVENEKGSDPPLKSGEKVEVVTLKGMRKGKYVKPAFSSHISYTNGKLQDAHWVEVGGKRVRAAESDIRRVKAEP